MLNFSYGRKFDFLENEPQGRTYFHVNGFTQRQKQTWKWPVTLPVAVIIKGKTEVLQVRVIL